MTTQAASREPVPDYSIVTEQGEALASRAQLVRAVTRYRFAASLCEGKEVLEVACGVGQGLGLFAKRARSVVGLDIEERNLARARATYRGRDSVKLVRGDAEALPFDDASFDVVLLYEAIYYLAHPERFAREARRVLRPGGVLLICTANRDLPDFNPSPFSKKYPNPPELAAMLEPLGFRVETFGEGPAGPPTLKRRALQALKRTAVHLNLIPGSMRGKVLLKRLVFGKLTPLPAELTEAAAEPEPLRPIPKEKADRTHSVLYCLGRLD